MFSKLDQPIWGASAIAEVINRSPSETYYLLERGLVPGRKVGKTWTSTRSELLTAVIGREPVEAE